MSKLYLVGVGPGEPELITLYAKRVLEEADVVAYPVKSAGEKSAALEIIKRTVNIRSAAELEFSMSPCLAKREGSRRDSAQKLIGILKEGKTAAMITLGDAGVYSTCGYVRDTVRAAGFEVETVPGIPSFTAAADAAGVNLCEGNERMAVVPGIRGRDDLEGLTAAFDTVVIMKAAAHMDIIYETLAEKGLLESSFAAKELYMPGGGVFPVTPEKSGYFTTVIIKKHG